MHEMTDKTALIASTASRMVVKGLFFMSLQSLYGFGGRLSNCFEETGA